VAHNSFGRKNRGAGCARIGAVRPGGRLGGARERVARLAVLFARRRHRGAPNESALQIRHAVCLAAVAGLLVLLGPPGSQVFVGRSFRICGPAGRHFPALDGGVRFAPVALPGHFDKRRAHDLALPGAETWLGQPRLEGGEECAEKFRARERRAERADGILIRPRAGFGQSEKRVETAAVADLKWRRFIAQPRERLAHENFERRPGPTGRATARGSARGTRAGTGSKIVPASTAFQAPAGRPSLGFVPGGGGRQTGRRRRVGYIGQVLSGRQVIPLTLIRWKSLVGIGRGFGKLPYYKSSLGALYANISSFKLKRGYAAVFAQTENGTGISKCYVAQDGDLEVSVLPPEFDRSVRFIYVTPWRWTGKKGIAGNPGNSLLNVRSWYDWNLDQNSSRDFEYVAIRQLRYWPGLSQNGQSRSVNTLLGYNEPDQASQANIAVGDAIYSWPDLLGTRLRVGSPAVSDGGRSSWLYPFMTQADAANLRVDFVPIHYYHCHAPSDAAGAASQMYSFLKATYD